MSKPTILESCLFKSAWYHNSSKYSATYLMNYKCGSTTLRNALSARKKSDKPLFDVFTVIRDPYERSESIYAQMVKSGKSFNLNFTDWLIKLQDGFYDYHQIPQTYWIEQAGDVKIFTSVDDALRYFNITPGKRLNKRSVGVTRSKEDNRLIEKLYIEDIRLWESNQ